MTLPLYYAGLPPGTRVTVRRVPVGLAAVENPRDETHVVGADGAGFTDVVRRRHSSQRPRPADRRDADAARSLSQVLSVAVDASAYAAFEVRV